MNHMSIEETYGFGILNEGQAIAVAKNVKIRPNEFTMPARSVFRPGLSVTEARKKPRAGVVGWVGLLLTGLGLICPFFYPQPCKNLTPVSCTKTGVGKHFPYVALSLMDKIQPKIPNVV